MLKVLFLCHGNICRSPAAEVVFNDEAKKRALAGKIIASSAALSDEEEGNGIYPPMKYLLSASGYKDLSHRARLVTEADLESFDLIVLMDSENLYLYKNRFGDKASDKVRLLLSFTKDGGEIDDPWYTRDFKRALYEIQTGVYALVDKLTCQIER
ncbi:MAG: low molecular weight phosphotyrosine protein phosphatase [Succinatimonas hippei]|nr:low molecular weight phosphotyrosine protein phosphatase [Succinatimonas hippei]